VLIQSNQGRILLDNQLSSTLNNGGTPLLTSETKITGRHISIDNTGGTVDAITGVITGGSGTSSSANAGIHIADGRAITALDNINIHGASTSGHGVNISGATNLSAGSAGYTGNLNITGINTTTSVASINIGNASASLTAQNIATLTSGVKASGSSLNVSGQIQVGAELQVENPNAGTISGVISGTGLLRKIGNTGAGTLTLLGTNTYMGGTVANGGTLQVGNGGTTGTLGTGSISVGALLTVNRSNEYTITDDISGVGQLWHIGAGTTILTGNNTYGGTTNVSAGTLQIGNRGSTGTVGSGNVILSNNSTLSFVRNVDTSLTSQVSGSGNLNATITGVGSDFNLGANVNFSNTGSTVRINTSGDVTQSSGSVAASNLFINSGGGIGTSANRIQTAVGALAMVSAGDQWVTEADYLTLAASTTHNGGINITTTNGPMIVIATAINGLSGINANGTGNVTLTGQSSIESGVRILGNITALAGDVTITGRTSTTSGTQAGVFSSATVRGKNITLNGSATGTSGHVLGYYGAGGHFIASETLTLTGTSTSSTGNGLYSFSGSFIAGTGMSLSGTSTNGQGVGFDAGITITNGNSGNLEISGTASTAGQQGIGLNGVVITNGTSGGGSTGAVTLEAHSGLLASTTSFGGVNRITQNGSGDVTLLTSGNSNLTVPIIVNNGTGDVIVAAGSDTAAGTGTGGQVLTLSGNSISQNNGGSTYVYSGQASGTGQLSHLSSAFNQLVYQGSGLSQNSRFNTAFVCHYSNCFLKWRR
jgi:fibronectin-binding autotransporter adhesin